jgi:DNA-binding MarR family transcriptional regulator
VHELISLIDAYERHDLDQFQRNYTSLNFRPESQKYLAVHDRLLFNMKKEKLTIVLKSYRTITFAYIARRLHLTTEQAERMVFELIADERVRGRIGQDANSGKFVEMLPERNEFLEIQAENLKELSKRYLITG